MFNVLPVTVTGRPLEHGVPIIQDDNLHCTSIPFLGSTIYVQS